MIFEKLVFNSLMRVGETVLQLHCEVFQTWLLCHVFATRERCIQELRRNGLTPPSELSSSKLGPISPNR